MSDRAGEVLDVYLSDDLIGKIERRGPRRFRFSYSEAVVSRREPGEIVLSASLPVREGAFTPSETRPFFDGLLPEGPVRSSLAQSLDLSTEDGFGLLAELGAECAGAVAVLQSGAVPSSSGEIRPIDGAELAELIEQLPEHPLGVDGRSSGVRLSLGGVQEKLILTRSPAGTYGQPLHGAPSTCILKPEHREFPGVVANELFGLRLAASSGLDAARAEAFPVAGRPCLYVERFDRTLEGDGRIVRLHQEDMCQALGIPPVDKYEASGGPTVAAMVELIREIGAARAAADTLGLLRAVLLNFLLGNSDAHGKNYSLLHDEAGIRFAPLYDLVSTQVYESVDERLAMSIGGVDQPDEVDIEAWRRLGRECGLGTQLADLIDEWTSTILRCAEAMVGTAKAEGWHEPVVDEIFGLMRRRAAQLER